MLQAFFVTSSQGKTPNVLPHILVNFYLTARTLAIYICADSPWIALQNSKNQKVPLEQLAVMRAQIWAKILCCGLHGMFTSVF